MQQLTKACLIAALFATACAEPQPEPRTDWDLLIIVLDALPAGHLGLYGYQPEGAPTPPISPRIDDFAAGEFGHEALIFDAAFSAASYTLASTASLFTGMNPAGHGVLGLSSNVLSAKHVTLAETFESAGFATAAFSANPNISSEGQFDQGFDTFRHYFRDKFEEHSIPATMLPDAGAWWQHHADQQRFLYVHLLPPHQPYDPPAPHAGLYGADEVPREEGLTPYLAELTQRTDLTATSPEVERIRRRYDAGVHYADELFGELLETLAGEDGHGLDQTLIVFTSDHGEAFAEHGLILHGGGVTPELCRVPLVIAFPEGGLEGNTRRFEHVVSTANLAPSLCELFDLAWPGEAKGTSFIEPALAGRSTDQPALSRSAGDRPIWSLRTDSSTLIEHRASKSTMLFDRSSDPGERFDRGDLEPQERTALSERLAAELKAARQAAAAYPRDATPELIHKDALEELGYFGK